MMSLNGGLAHRRSKDGRELFYIRGTKLMAAPISIDPTFSLNGPATQLFEIPDGFFSGTTPVYDITSDGQFIVAEDGREDVDVRRASIHIIENGYEEFRDQK